MASAVEELTHVEGVTITRRSTLLIDDDPKNVATALNSGVKAIMMDVKDPNLTAAQVRIFLVRRERQPPPITRPPTNPPPDARARGVSGAPRETTGKRAIAAACDFYLHREGVGAPRAVYGALLPA